MATLSFNLVDLKPIIEHALAAKEHGLSCGQLCEKSLWKPGAQPNHYGMVEAKDIDQSKVPASLFFVKDSGAYLMSAGKPGLMAGEGERHVVVYAKGCNPDTDEDCWDTCRDKCGGDDFGEALPVAMFQEAMKQKPNAKRLVVTLLKRSIRIHAA